MPPRVTWNLPHHHVGRIVHVYDAVPSTNDLAAVLLPGSAVLAAVQTAGRGQRGSTWLAEPGSSVLLSVVLAPPPTLRRPAVLTAWAAVSVAEVVRRTTGRQARIKWPNDVLIRGHKVCGILIETAVRGGEPTSVVGIGLNLNQSPADFAAAGLPRATSLACVAGRAFDAADVARALLAELDAQYAAVVDGELAALESVWVWRVGLLGHDATIETVDGATHHGRLVEMAFDGVTVESGGRRTAFAPEAVRHLTRLTGGPA